MHSVTGRAKFTRDNVVKNGFEVVEEDGVGCAFEDERETPVGVYAAARCDFGGTHGDVGE